MSRPLEELGQAAAEALGTPDEARQARQRQALIEAASGGARRKSRRWVGALAAVAVVGLAIVWLAWPGAPPIDYWVGTEGTARHGEVSLRAPAEAALPVRFAEGSALELAADTQVKVTRATLSQARVELARGRIEARITPGTGLAWRFVAGAFEVEVTGTVLTVSRGADGVAVSVSSGRVRVTGPGLASGRMVNAGERLSLDAAGPHLERASAAEPAPVPTPVNPAMAPAVDEPPSTAPTGGLEQPPLKRPQARAEPKPSPPPPWQRLAGDGHYADALGIAKVAGWSATLEHTGQSNLLLLANTARYAHDAGAARDALETLQRRFPTSHEAERAPFLLGRTALELERDGTAAAQGFRAYLAAHPKGELAEEAAGRLLEALQLSGDLDGARKEAQHYLERYPQGSYVALARSLTSR